MSGNRENKNTKNADKLFMVERGLAAFGDGSNRYEDYLERPISDEFRKLIGAFWINTGGSQKLQANQSNPVRINRIGIRYDEESGSVEEEFEYRYNSEVLGSSMLHQGLKDSLRSDSYIEDHATVINVYEEGSNLAEQAAGLLNLYAEVKSDYNFLEKEFEEFVLGNDASIRDSDLPNFYNFVIKREGGENIVRNSILSLNGRIEQSEPRGLGGGKSTDLAPVSDYYGKWVSNFLDYKEDPEYSRDSSMTQNIFFTDKETSELGELFKYKETFPIFNTIEFNVENDGRLGTTLEQTNFSHQLSEYLKQANPSQLETSEVRVNMREEIMTNEEGTQSFSELNNESEVSYSNNRIIYDIDEFFETYEAQENTGIIFNNDILNGPDYLAYYNLMSLIVRGRVEKIKNDVVRSFDQIMAGETSYNEPIFYKIRKRDEEGNLLQTFHFTNTEELEVIKFVDTQVKYDKRYSYEILSMNLVVGTKYKYRHLQEIGISRQTTDGRSLVLDRGRFSVTSEPSVKIIEVPLFEKSVIILDNPPIAPELDIIPLKGISNKLKLFFNSAVGRYKAKPIFMEPDESKEYGKFKIAQDIPFSEPEIMFETDDSASEFILYRLDSEPNTYRDFLENGTRIGILTDMSSSASHEDTIVPNKKYYYCLRSRDYHGNLSYPSDIYQVEMIEDTGSIYPIIRIYNIEREEPKITTKGVKRFIHISPSYDSLFVDRDSIEGDGPELGMANVPMGNSSEDSVWGKKFKMRLTSKTTGKKIDFNFSFNTKQNPEAS